MKILLEPTVVILNVCISLASLAFTWAFMVFCFKLITGK